MKKKKIVGYVPAEHYVYYMLLNDDMSAVKIGATVNLKRRLAEMRSKVRHLGTLELVAAVVCKDIRCQYRHPDNYRTKCLSESKEHDRCKRYEAEVRPGETTEWFYGRGSFDARISALKFILGKVAEVAELDVNGVIPVLKGYEPKAASITQLLAKMSEPARRRLTEQEEDYVSDDDDAREGLELMHALEGDYDDEGYL